jgi:hypothetical protein
MNLIEKFVYLLGWLRIVISPLSAGAIIGFFYAQYNRGTTGMIIGIGIYAQSKHTSGFRYYPSRKKSIARNIKTDTLLYNPSRSFLSPFSYICPTPHKRGKSHSQRITILHVLQQFISKKIRNSSSFRWGRYSWPRIT